VWSVVLDRVGEIGEADAACVAWSLCCVGNVPPVLPALADPQHPSEAVRVWKLQPSVGSVDLEVTDVLARRFEAGNEARGDPVPELEQCRGVGRGLRDEGHAGTWADL